MTPRALVGVCAVCAVVACHGQFGRDQGPDGVRGVAQPLPSVTALPLPPKATRLPCAGGVRRAETPTAGEVSRPYGGSMASPELSGNPAGAGWVSVSAPARNSSAPPSRKDNRILGAVRTKAAGCEVTPKGVSPIAHPAAGYLGGEHGTVAHTVRQAPRGGIADSAWNPCVYTQYGAQFEGRRCADGSRFSHRRLIVAARGIPRGTRLELAYGARGRCRAIVADTGTLPLHRPGRPQLDVSAAVARSLGLYDPRWGRYGKYRIEGK